MMKYLLAIIIFVTTGSLFFWQLEHQQSAAEPVQNTADDNPFGEGTQSMGSFDDDEEVEDEDEDDDTTLGSSSGQSVTPATPTGRIVTRTMLSSHNTEADCWVAYKGAVYDITSWLPRHPGSAAAIAPYCGTAEEFTAAFGKQHGTSKEGRLKQEGTMEGTLSN